MSKRFILAGLLGLTMLTAPSFAANDASAAPDGWKFVPIRAEAAPTSSVERDGSSYTLVISGNKNAVGDGRWTRTVDLPQSRHVSFSAKYRAANVEMAARNVIASLVWLDEKGEETAREFLDTNTPADAHGWHTVSGTYAIPAKAKKAQIDLRLRWAPSARIEWRDAEFKAAQPPAARIVKVASVNHRPRGNKTAQDNLNEFAKWIDEAGKKKADIVCLPEAITLIGRGADYLGNVETIPGPSTEFLGTVAKRNNTYIVAGLLERDGHAAYNTAVLIGRDGSLVGKYRKVCLPTGEYNGGLAAGSDFPVFKTDFGTIGIMICWDVAYPEVSRELAAKGAEVILMPIWGGNETLCKARAIENQIPLVISSYDLRSAIYNQAGEPTAQAPDTSSTVVYSDLNLAEPMNWKWSGNWRSRIWLEGPVRKDAVEPGGQAVSTSKAQAD